MRLHPKIIDLSLDRVERLLELIGNPERQLPPVVHVAGTNGKGSVIAYLRAMLEAAGKRVHVYTSPHLVRFHERIRLAGALIDEHDAGRPARGMRARPTAASRSPSSRSPPSPPSSPSRACRPTSCCWRPGLGGGSTPPT